MGRTLPFSTVLVLQMLVISRRMNFSQSTVMKGMIENVAQKGMKDSLNGMPIWYLRMLNQLIQWNLKSGAVTR